MLVRPGTSNGGLTAHPGGDRWHWEHHLFGGAYDDALPSARPKYGSLNYRRRPAGGSVRFGSAHFRLKHPVRRRTTFCYPDSSSHPADFGTADQFPLLELAEQAAPDVLDDHIEAHIHGPLRLAEDVAGLVLDPSFAGTGVEDAARATGLPVAWRGGCGRARSSDREVALALCRPIRRLTRTYPAPAVPSGADLHYPDRSRSETGGNAWRTGPIWSGTSGTSTG